MALEGDFKNNKTRLAPPGTKVMVPKKTDKRTSWAAHGVYGWYLILEMDHYCCYYVYVTSTRAKRKSNTVQFLMQHTKVPGIDAIAVFTTTSQQLVTTSSNTKPNTAVEKFGHWQLAALSVLT